MLRTTLIGAVTLLAGASVQPLAAQGHDAEATVASGAQVYGTMCGRCHVARSPLERTDRAWVTIVNHMRVRANLTGGQVRAVLAFLQATNNDPRERRSLIGDTLIVLPEPPTPIVGPASRDPAVIAEGERLVQRNACLGCHVIGRAGGQVGPSLSGVVGRRGADLVRRKLVEPTFNNPASMMPNFGLNAEQVEAITAYLATVGR